jgi:gamma-glutamylputrescine oxidase
MDMSRAIVAIYKTVTFAYNCAMTRSFWHRKRKRDRIRAGTDIPVSGNCDVAVVGGGIVGIATAYYLRKFGCRKIVVLERDFVGSGASGRNAGFILSGMSEPYSRLVVGMGATGARNLMAATLENHELIANAVAEMNIECDYHRSGSLRLATSDVEVRELQQSAEQLERHGFDAEYVAEVQDGAGRPLEGYLGALRVPADGRLDPFAFVNGLAEGLSLCQGCEVEKITRTDGAVELHGRVWKIKSEMAVIAVNGYAPLLDVYFQNMVFPVRGQMLATRPVRERMLEQSPYSANFGYDYFRQTADNAILIGGLRNRFINEEVGYDDSLNPELQEGLENYLTDGLGVAEFDVDCRWTGVMGNTIDGLPLVGALPRNSSVLAAVGFNGHGFGLGMVVARDLARAVMKNEGSGLLDRFSLKRFVR